MQKEFKAIGRSKNLKEESIDDLKRANVPCDFMRLAMRRGTKIETSAEIISPSFP